VAWAIGHDRSSTFWAAVAGLIGVAGSLLSPQGLALWTGPLRTIGNPLLSSFNLDWQSLRPFQANLAATGLLILLALLVGLWRATDPRALAALGLVLPTIQLARFTPFSAPLLADSTANRLTERWPFLGTTSPRPRSVIVASWALLVLGLPAVLLWPGAPRSIDGAMMVQPLPDAAVQQLMACGTPAPIWNDYFWGGYLIWTGHGQWPVGIDGRMETLYTNNMLQDYLAVQNGDPGWQEIIEHSPARYALVRPPVAERLDALPDWTSVYVDDSAAVVSRKGSPWHCLSTKDAESSSTRPSGFTVS
jgi:hypothetical protein